MPADITDIALFFRRLWRRTRPRQLPPPRDDNVIGTTASGEGITWPKTSPERAGHIVIMAASGAGKTALTAGAILAEWKTSLESGDEG